MQSWRRSENTTIIGSAKSSPSGQTILSWSIFREGKKGSLDVYTIGGTQLSQYAFTLEQTLYVQKATIEISSSRMDKDTRHQGVIEGLDEKIRRDNIEYARQISETSRTSQGTVDIGQEADPLVKDLGRDLINEHLDPEWRILGGTRR